MTSNQYKPIQTGFGRLGVCYMYVCLLEGEVMFCVVVCLFRVSK